MNLAGAKQSEIAKLLGRSVQQVNAYGRAEPPIPRLADGKYAAPDVVEWWAVRRATEAVAKALKQRGPASVDGEISLDEARRREGVARAILAEMDVAEREGALLPAETVSRIVGEMCDGLRAELVNLPANYALDLERAGVPAADAEALLEQIAEKMTRAMRRAADRVEHGDGASDSDA